MLLLAQNVVATSGYPASMGNAKSPDPVSVGKVLEGSSGVPWRNTEFGRQFLRKHWLMRTLAVSANSVQEPHCKVLDRHLRSRWNPKQE